MNYADLARKANMESKYEFLSNGNLNVEHAAIMYKNFGGKPTKFNPIGGKRTFDLCVSKDIADTLKANHWNVKAEDIDGSDDKLYHTEIVVNENGNPPPCIYKTSEFNGKKTKVIMRPEYWCRIDGMKDDGSAGDNITNVDVMVHPYLHGRNSADPDAKKGYLSTMFASIASVNVFGGKYDEYEEVEE